MSKVGHTLNLVAPLARTDAVCINQMDISELSRQVKRMKEIYEKAWSVAVWLGDVSEDSATAADFVSSIANRPPISWEFLRKVQSKWSAKLATLFEQPYWERVWIIQELAMNPRSFFIYGNKLFLREELRETLNYCARLGHMIKAGFFRDGRAVSPVHP